MKLVNVIDFGNAPDFYVTGPAEIERVNGQVIVPFYVRRHEENVLVCRIIWDAEAFERAQASYRKFRMTENKDMFEKVN